MKLMFSSPVSGSFPRDSCFDLKPVMTNDWNRPRNRNYYHSLTYIFALRACACPQGGV